MAGRRQHYIPRLLLRGFLASPAPDAERTWLHRMGRAGKLVGIRDVGVQENFYSKLGVGNTPTLDDLITALEGELDADLKAIRTAPVGVVIESVLAARLVAHLVLRTAHVRSVFAQATGRILDEVAALAADSDGLRRYVGIDNSDPPLASASLFGEVLKGLSIENLPLPPAFKQRVVRFWIRERFNTFHDQFQHAALAALTQFRSGLSAVIRDGHNRALATADQSKWIADLSALSWTTLSATGAVLPDCVVVAREVGGGFAPLLLADRQEIGMVILPIAHDRLLVGRAGASSDLTIASINEACALCSDTFFVSHAADCGLGLSNMIGLRCTQAISTVVDEAVSDLRHTIPTGSTKRSQEAREIGTAATPPFGFSLSCIDCADAETTAKLGDILQIIVREVGREHPLAALDGMTFAANYPSAVEGLDRGDLALPVERSRPRSYGRAVAKCVRVLRNGDTKQHIVFDALVADNLLAEDGERRDLGIHMVVGMLADVSHSAIYESQISDAPILSWPDCVAGWLHQATATAPGRYFAARASAFADQSSGERYATLVRDSLSSAQEQIRVARLAYRLDANLDALLAVAVPQISFVLDHAAEWLGHRDGLPSPDTFVGSSLPDDLSASDLDHWLELFGRDLRRLYDEEGQFTIQNLVALSQHAERLLWTVQICPWPTERDSLYVSVPMGSDADTLDARSSAGT